MTIKRTIAYIYIYIFKYMYNTYIYMHDEVRRQPQHSKHKLEANFCCTNWRQP